MIGVKLPVLSILLLAAATLMAVPRYLHVTVSGENDESKPVCSASLGFDLLDERQQGGVYYIAGNSCGITSEASRYQLDGLEFELVFNFQILGSGDYYLLAGATRALNYRGGSGPGRAERSSIEKQIPIGVKVPISSFSLPDGRQVTISVKLAETLPTDCPDCKQSAVSLRSVFSRNGNVFSSARVGKKFLAEAMEFHSSFEADAAGAGSPQFLYQVLVQIPNALDALTQPTETQVTLQRIYQFSSSHRSDPKNQTEGRFSSRITRAITLEPGKELRLVIPPDTPSLGGFEILDTLIILPK